MQATNTADLHVAMVAAIQGITPRYEYQRARTWHHVPAARTEDIEGTALRDFYLEHAPARANDMFFGQGQSYEYVLRIVTSYAGVPALHLDHIITADGVDLWQMFEGLYDPTTPGLYSCEYEGADVDGADIDEAGNVVIDHVFRVVYNQDL